MNPISIRPIANQMEKMALSIHAMQIAAYRQEAALLGAREFPPLNRTLRDVMASSDSFFGAFDGEELLGVISLEQRNENEVSISSLTVAPPFQRLGVAGPWSRVSRGGPGVRRSLFSQERKTLPLLRSTNNWASSNVHESSLAWNNWKSLSSPRSVLTLASANPPAFSLLQSAALGAAALSVFR